MLKSRTATRNGGTKIVDREIVFSTILTTALGVADVEAHMEKVENTKDAHEQLELDREKICNDFSSALEDSSANLTVEEYASQAIDIRPTLKLQLTAMEEDDDYDLMETLQNGGGDVEDEPEHKDADGMNAKEQDEKDKRQRQAVNFRHMDILDVVSARINVDGINKVRRDRDSTYNMNQNRCTAGAIPLVYIWGAIKFHNRFEEFYNSFGTKIISGDGKSKLPRFKRFLNHDKAFQHLLEPPTGLDLYGYGSRGEVSLMRSFQTWGWFDPGIIDCRNKTVPVSYIIEIYNELVKGKVLTIPGDSFDEDKVVRDLRTCEENINLVHNSKRSHIQNFYLPRDSPDKFLEALHITDSPRVKPSTERELINRGSHELVDASVVNNPELATHWMKKLLHSPNSKVFSTLSNNIWSNFILHPLMAQKEKESKSTLGLPSGTGIPDLNINMLPASELLPAVAKFTMPRPGIKLLRADHGVLSNLYDEKLDVLAGREITSVVEQAYERLGIDPMGEVSIETLDRYINTIVIDNEEVRRTLERALDVNGEKKIAEVFADKVWSRAEAVRKVMRETFQEEDSQFRQLINSKKKKSKVKKLKHKIGKAFRSKKDEDLRTKTFKKIGFKQISKNKPPPEGHERTSNHVLAAMLWSMGEPFKAAGRAMESLITSIEGLDRLPTCDQISDHNGHLLRNLGNGDLESRRFWEAYAVILRSRNKTIVGGEPESLLQLLVPSVTAVRRTLGKEYEYLLLPLLFCIALETQQCDSSDGKEPPYNESALVTALVSVFYRLRESIQEEATEALRRGEVSRSNMLNSAYDEIVRHGDPVTILKLMAARCPHSPPGLFGFMCWALSQWTVFFPQQPRYTEAVDRHGVLWPVASRCSEWAFLLSISSYFSSIREALEPSVLNASVYVSSINKDYVNYKDRMKTIDEAQARIKKLQQTTNESSEREQLAVVRQARATVKRSTETKEPNIASFAEKTEFFIPQTRGVMLSQQHERHRAVRLKEFGSTLEHMEGQIRASVDLPDLIPLIFSHCVLTSKDVGDVRASELWRNYALNGHSKVPGSKSGIEYIVSTHCPSRFNPDKDMLDKMTSRIRSACDLSGLPYKETCALLESMKGSDVSERVDKLSKLVLHVLANYSLTVFRRNCVYGAISALAMTSGGMSVHTKHMKDNTLFYFGLYWLKEMNLLGPGIPLANITYTMERYCDQPKIIPSLNVVRNTGVLKSQHSIREEIVPIALWLGRRVWRILKQLIANVENPKLNKIVQDSVSNDLEKFLFYGPANSFPSFVLPDKRIRLSSAHKIMRLKEYSENKDLTDIALQKRWEKGIMEGPTAIGTIPLEELHTFMFPLIHRLLEAMYTADITKFEAFCCRVTKRARELGYISHVIKSDCGKVELGRQYLRLWLRRVSRHDSDEYVKNILNAIQKGDFRARLAGSDETLCGENLDFKPDLHLASHNAALLKFCYKGFLHEAFRRTRGNGHQDATSVLRHQLDDLTRMNDVMLQLKRFRKHSEEPEGTELAREQIHDIERSISHKLALFMDKFRSTDSVRKSVDKVMSKVSHHAGKRFFCTCCECLNCPGDSHSPIDGTSLRRLYCRDIIITVFKMQKLNFEETAAVIGKVVWSIGNRYYDRKEGVDSPWVNEVNSVLDTLQNDPEKILRDVKKIKRNELGSKVWFRLGKMILDDFLVTEVGLRPMVLGYDNDRQNAKEARPLDHEAPLCYYTTNHKTFESGVSTWTMKDFIKDVPQIAKLLKKVKRNEAARGFGQLPFVNMFRWIKDTWSEQNAGDYTKDLYDPALRLRRFQDQSEAKGLFGKSYRNVPLEKGPLAIRSYEDFLAMSRFNLNRPGALDMQWYSAAKLSETMLDEIPFTSLSMNTNRNVVHNDSYMFNIYEHEQERSWNFTIATALDTRLSFVKRYMERKKEAASYVIKGGQTIMKR